MPRRPVAPKPIIAEIPAEPKAPALADLLAQVKQMQAKYQPTYPTVWVDEVTMYPYGLDDKSLRALTALETLQTRTNVMPWSHHLDALAYNVQGLNAAQPNAWPYGHIPSSYTPRYAPWGATIRKVVAGISHSMSGEMDDGEDFWVSQHDRRLNYQPTDDEVMATFEAGAGRASPKRMEAVKSWLVSARLAEDIHASLFKQGQHMVEMAEAEFRRVQLQRAEQQRDALRKLMMNSPTYVITQDRLKNLIGDVS